MSVDNKIYVTKAVDDGTEGTLRWAIDNSKNGDTIMFNETIKIIALNKPIDIKTELNIQGNLDGVISYPNIQRKTESEFLFGEYLMNIEGENGVKISNLTFSDLIRESNFNLGAIKCTSGKIIVQDCDFSSFNIDDDNYSVVYLENVKDVKINNCSYSDIYQGYSVSLNNTSGNESMFDVMNCSFGNNSDESVMRGIKISSPGNVIGSNNTVNIENCDFNTYSKEDPFSFITGNSIYVRTVNINNSSTLNVNNCTFSGNGKGNATNLIYLAGHFETIIDNSRFIDVKSSEMISVITYGMERKLVIRNTEFIDNMRTEIRRIIYSAMCKIELDNVIMDGITASEGIVRCIGSSLSVNDCSVVRCNVTASIIGLFSVDGNMFSVENSTFSNNGDENETARSIFDINQTSTLNMVNNTICRNKTRGISFNNASVVLRRVIANNVFYENVYDGEHVDILSDNVSRYSIMNNYISSDRGFNRDEITNDTNMIATGQDPMLGEIEYSTNGTLVIPIKEGSPLINAGENSVVITEYDQRGKPYVRIYDNIVDIGSYEYQPVYPVPCYDGESMILTRDINTRMVKEIPAREVYAGVHEVYDTANKRFINVIHNAVSEGATKMCIIKKNSVSYNKPNRDLKITPGHYVIAHGKITKAKDVRGVKKMNVKPQKVYSIVTEKWTPISVDGLDVYSWSKKKWTRKCMKNKTDWKENKQKLGYSRK